LFRSPSLIDKNVRLNIKIGVRILSFHLYLQQEKYKDLKMDD
jgi:hypothetical protein